MAKPRVPSRLSTTPARVPGPHSPSVGVRSSVRGGAYGPGTPREGWDHNTGYLRRILADIWGADLTIVERELTLVGINPALDQFTDLAAAVKATAHDEATTAGKALATH